MKWVRDKLFTRLAICLVTIVIVTSWMLSGAAEAQASMNLKNPVATDKGDGNQLAVWDCVYFGHYPQSKDGKGGFAWEPIKWRVLSVEGNEALLLADKNLDVLPYHEERTGISWEKSTLRSWLNGYESSINACGKDFTRDNFLDIAFTSAEQVVIKVSDRGNGDNPNYGTDGGNLTRDKVFLLSFDELTTSSYGFHEDGTNFDDGREGRNTDYVSFGGDMAGPGYADFWWISTPGVSTAYASVVDHDGYIDVLGSIVNGSNVAVRPALRLDLSSNLWKYAGIVFSDGAEVAYIGEKVVNLHQTVYTYNGSYCKPAVSISGLQEGTDYTVAYKNHKYPGTATVIVTGKGNYTGSVSKDFTIQAPSVPSLKKVSVRLVKGDYDAIYASWSKVTVTGADVKYKIQYKAGSKNWKTASSGSTKTAYAIKGLADGKKCYVKVTPYVALNEEHFYAPATKSAAVYTLKKPDKLSVKRAGSKKVNLSWNDISGESGYEIYKSEKKTKGFRLVKRVHGTKIKSVTLKAQKKKTCYYKVRAFKNVKIKGRVYRVYGPWSAVKRYKLK